MPSAKKTKFVCYRRCQIFDATRPDAPISTNLQVLLEQAMTAAPKPWMRMVGTTGTVHQFLIQLTHRNGCISGSLVLCEKGRKIQLVDYNTETGDAWSEAIPPHDSKGQPRRLQESSLFFAVKENHVAVVASKELDITEFQGFLWWFIQTSAQLAPNLSIHLINLPSATALEKLKDQRVRGIKIGRNAIEVNHIPTPETEGQKRRKYTREIKTDPMALAWLRGVIKDQELFERWSNSSQPEGLYVELQISYHSRSEKDSQEVMRALAATMGDKLDEGSEIQLSGKSSIKGSELTIKDPISIQAPDGFIAADDAINQISDWLIKAITSHRVLL